MLALQLQPAWTPDCAHTGMYVVNKITNKHKGNDINYVRVGAEKLGGI